MTGRDGCIAGLHCCQAPLPNFNNNFYFSCASTPSSFTAWHSNQHHAAHHSMAFKPALCCTSRHGIQTSTSITACCTSQQQDAMFCPCRLSCGQQGPKCGRKVTITRPRCRVARTSASTMSSGREGGQVAAYCWLWCGPLMITPPAA